MKRNRIQFESNGEHSSTSPVTAPGTTSRTPDEESPNPSRHIPKISRKIRACTECKRHKVRCDMKPGETICRRCQRMGLHCIVNKSLQTLLDDEAEWKTMIELAMSDLLRRAQLPELSYYQAGGTASHPGSTEPTRKWSTVSGSGSVHQEEHTESGDIRPDQPQSAGSGSHRHRRERSHYSPEREEAGTNTLVTAPMGSLYEVTQLSHSRGNSPATQQYLQDRSPATDFVSRGVVDLVEAEELFNYFDARLNHFLWDGIAMPHKDLVSVRKSSSLLLSAILAVTALHIPHKERLFDTCYAEFARLASDSMLNRHHTFDDLRGLCIGAFWLSDVSWKLSGYAVRIATERNLHQCYRKAVQGSPEHKEQARLWYLLYVLEHHYSIAYGRPPMIHEDACITNHTAFVNTPTVEQRDIRIHSQVALFIILTRIYHAFGPDVELEVAEGDLPRIEQFDADLEQWRITWEPRLVGNPYVGAYPYKAVYLHFHFSRLTLNSIALRTYHSASSNKPLSRARKEYAQIAIDSALATLKVVLDEPDIQKSLVGVPLFLHSMITFAAVFLLKIAVKGHPTCRIGNQGNSIASAGLRIDIPYIQEIVERTVELMVSISEQASERHLSHHIARGLGKMLEGFQEWDKRNPHGQTAQQQQQRQLQPQQQQPSWLQETSVFNPISMPGTQTLGERATILNHPPAAALLGVAPLSAERSNNSGFATAPSSGQSPATPTQQHQHHQQQQHLEKTRQLGLNEGSLDPMMADIWGFDEEYFPTGVFDFLQSQMPA